MGSMQSTEDFDTRTLEKGDIVVFHRFCLQHYGVYVGNDEIIHFSGSHTRDAVVKKENIWKVAKNSSFTKGNTDEKRRPLPKEDIVKNALSQMGQGEYDLFEFNCERFANWCRYGVTESIQFADYVTEQLVESDGGGMWNHFNTDGSRTSNRVGGWHSKMKKTGISHPNIFKFIIIESKQQTFIENTIVQLDNGGRRKHKSRRIY